MMQSVKQGRCAVVFRSDATKALREMVRNVGGDPLRYALPSGRIGGATQLSQIWRVGNSSTEGKEVEVRSVYDLCEGPTGGYQVCVKCPGKYERNEAC